MEMHRGEHVAKFIAEREYSSLNLDASCHILKSQMTYTMS